MEKVSSIARSINKDICNKNIVSAYAEIKKTIELWKVKRNRDLLCDNARIIAEHSILKTSRFK